MGCGASSSTTEIVQGNAIQGKKKRRDSRDLITTLSGEFEVR